MFNEHISPICNAAVQTHSPSSLHRLTCPICEFAGERGTDIEDVIEPTGEALSA